MMQFFYILCIPLASLSISTWGMDLCPTLFGGEATQQAQYEVFVSPYAHHWSPDPEHKPVRLLAINKRGVNDRFCGLSGFSNSFGKPSLYAYLGKIWNDPLRWTPDNYVRVSAGIVYGYVGQYQDKIPMNVHGFAPVFIPALGHRLRHNTSLELHLLGKAGFILGANFVF